MEYSSQRLWGRISLVIGSLYGLRTNRSNFFTMR
jgi:hypothetical protein